MSLISPSVVILGDPRAATVVFVALDEEPLLGGLRRHDFFERFLLHLKRRLEGVAEAFDLLLCFDKERPPALLPPKCGRFFDLLPARNPKFASCPFAASRRRLNSAPVSNQSAVPRVMTMELPAIDDRLEVASVASKTSSRQKTCPAIL